MSINSSSACDGSYSFPEFTNRDVTSYINVSVSLMNVALVLPLCVAVLLLCYQRLKHKPAAASVTFSDSFTYNLTVMELVGVCGRIVLLCDHVSDVVMLYVVGAYVSAFPWNGQMFFPILTSVDRYLAVVHPITYLRLKQRTDLKYLLNVGVWLMCLGAVACLPFLTCIPEFMLVPSACLMVTFLLVSSFCSFSVLRVLKRPRPGVAGRDRDDQSKQRAFKTILIIVAVLTLRFGGTLVFNALYTSPSVNGGVKIIMAETHHFFLLPSSLVLPLLFLHRAGKLARC